VQRSHIVIYGFVQGVGFRFAVQRTASSRSVSGWVRNRPDGAVEAGCEGEQADVDALVDFGRSGPRGADVERVAVEAELPEGLAGFRVTG